MDNSTPVCYTWEKHENTFQKQFCVFEEVEVTRLSSRFLGTFLQAGTQNSHRTPFLNCVLTLQTCLIHMGTRQVYTEYTRADEVYKENWTNTLKITKNRNKHHKYSFNNNNLGPHYFAQLIANRDTFQFFFILFSRAGAQTLSDKGLKKMLNNYRIFKPVHKPSLGIFFSTCSTLVQTSTSAYFLYSPQSKSARWRLCARLH